MESLNFRMPEQQVSGDNAFDSRPGSVRQWLEQLPMGSMPEAARMLHGALHETNRLKIPLEQRVHMLEAISVPLHNVLNGLMQHVGGQHLPLAAQFQRVGDFTRQLLTEAVIAYQIVLNGEQNGSWLFRLTHHDLWPLCIHRMLHFLGRLYQLHMTMHQPYPPGLWLSMHRLFAEADEHGRRAEMIAMPWEMGRRESIEQCYIQQLLSSLLDPGRLTSSQLELVRQQLSGWALLVTLHPAEQWQPGLAAYWVRLDLDNPHTNSASQSSLQEQRHARALLMDLGALQQAIQERCAHPDNGNAADKLHPDTLTTLAEAWRVPTGPREQRKHSHAQRQVAVGISALFTLLRTENRHLRDGISDQHFTDDLKPLLPVAAKTEKSPQPKTPATVWDSIFFATELQLNSWSMDSDEAEYHYISTHELDYSQNGNCLVFRTDDIHTLDVGELIGFRQHPGGALQLCEVRWIQQQDDRLQTGTMTVANEMEPILCIMHEDKQRTPLACLLGIGLDGQPQLFLPHLPGLTQRRLSLVVDKHEVPIVLQQRSALSPLFIAYHFALHPNLQKEGHFAEDMDMEELNRRLHQVIRPQDVDKSTSKDDFSDLWDSL